MSDETVANLGFKVGSEDLDAAKQKLGGLATEAGKTSQAVDGLNKSFVGLGSAVKDSPFAAMTQGIASANKAIETVAPKAQSMGASIAAALAKSTISFDQMTKGITAANSAVVAHASEVGKSAEAHDHLSTQSMAAFHSVRSLSEAMLAGSSPVQALAQQLNHLSFAASGPGGVTEAFAGVARMIGPTGFLIGGIAGLGALGAALAKVSDETQRNKSSFEAMTGSAKGGLDTYNAVRDVAHKTGADFDVLSDAVTRATQGQALAADRNVIYADSAGKAAADAKKLAGTFGELNKIMEASGATSATEAKVFEALGGSLQKSGTLTASAFQAIRDASLPLAKALADAFGEKDINKFQAKLENTPITLKELQDRIDRIKPSIDAAFDARPINTVEQSTREVGKAFEDLKKSLAEAGAVGLVRDSLTGLAKGVKEISDSIPGMKDQFDSAKNSTKGWGDLIKVADDQNSLFGKSIEVDIGGGITKYISLLTGGISAAWNFEKEVGSALASLAQKAIAAGQSVASAIAAIARAASSAVSNPGNVPASGNPMGDGEPQVDMSGGSSSNSGSSYSGGSSSYTPTGGTESVPMGGATTDFASAVADGTFPAFASGTDSAPGGPSRINEQGGEIVNLPDGSQVIPHDVSMQMAAASPLATVKEITDAIDQSTIDISKKVSEGSDNIVTELKKLTGGVAAVNPATGLSAGTSTTGTTTTTGIPALDRALGLKGASGGGGGFSTRPSQAGPDFQKINNARGGDAPDPMYAMGTGSGAYRGFIKGSGFGAPTGQFRPAMNPDYSRMGASGSSTGYPGGEGGIDPRSDPYYGMDNPNDFYGSDWTFSSTGDTSYGSNSAGSNYSSDYGGSTDTGITGFDPSAMSYGGGSTDYGYFKTGGQFKVGGSGGTDSQLIQLHTTPGEIVTVTPDGVPTPNSINVPSLSSSGPTMDDPSQANMATTMTKNVNIYVQEGIQAEQFIRSRAQIARGF